MSQNAQPTSPDSLGLVETAARQFKKAEHNAQTKRDQLDDAIRAAHTQGVTMYRLSKATGFSQPTIKRIVK